MPVLAKNTYTCEVCSKQFTKRGRKPARHCSRPCRNTGWARDPAVAERLAAVRGTGKNRTPTLEEAFWAHVGKTPTCWRWTGQFNGRGYGRFRVAGKWHLAHRFSYELAKGPLPPGLFACHNCPGGDNKWCVNPDHLWPGTDQQNKDDARRKRELLSADH